MRVRTRREDIGGSKRTCGDKRCGYAATIKLEITLGEDQGYNPDSLSIGGLVAVAFLCSDHAEAFGEILEKEKRESEKIYEGDQS